MNRYVIFGGYLLMAAAIVYGMFVARRITLAEFGSAAAQQQWQTWRDQATEQADPDGPVQRRPSNSPEPPALVLMRDYFGVCLIFAIAMSSMLYGALALMVVGALAKPDLSSVDSSE